MQNLQHMIALSIPGPQRRAFQQINLAAREVPKVVSQVGNNYGLALRTANRRVRWHFGSDGFFLYGELLCRPSTYAVASERHRELIAAWSVSTGSSSTRNCFVGPAHTQRHLKAHRFAL